MESRERYQSTNKIRILTAGSLFDGHDAAINIMRRLMQKSGVEIIHLGHNRSALEIAEAAVQEDVQGIAITSYQGGHMEFFKFLADLLKAKCAGHIKVFGGGGGTILPEEITELHEYGISFIYSPEDGQRMGLQGMINHLLSQCDFPLYDQDQESGGSQSYPNKELARKITKIENQELNMQDWNKSLHPDLKVWGVTGTGGSGKSSLIDEVVLRFLQAFPQKRVAILSIDPTKKKTGGALLGDRIRMNSIFHPNIYMRSMATRAFHQSISNAIGQILQLFSSFKFDWIILETAGIGQSNSEITDFSNHSTYVMTPEFGAPSQLEKIDMLDFADTVVINKSDKSGAQDALREVRKQYQRNRELFHLSTLDMPVFPVIASSFNDHGLNAFFEKLMYSFFPGERMNEFSSKQNSPGMIISGRRVGYLGEIAETVRNYNREVKEQCHLTSEWYALTRTKEILEGHKIEAVKEIELAIQKCQSKISPENQSLIQGWNKTNQKYRDDQFIYSVRNEMIRVNNYFRSLSQMKIPKVGFPVYRDWGDLLKWQLQENFPGIFPFTSGVFPYRRENEDPIRMFAGEGEPERTNRRFHYLSFGLPARRLSTAFDSVTLYGEDPGIRPDIFGKVGNSGVSICTLDDAKILYSGFDLCDMATSVSMTINGPAATIGAFFLNAAIDQQCEKYIVTNNLQPDVEKCLKEKYDQQNIPRPAYYGAFPAGHNGFGLLLLGLSGDEILERDQYERIKSETLQKIRGTIQADILKEDQAQNTCIYSTPFSLRLMGDMQEYFIKNQIRNFYSVSISGYHIAEAGANPISQLAFTLANGFTYVEYYLHRGLRIDDFAPNLSFFFSNGVDPEYAVIGRVARRIWSKTMKYLYHAAERSQKLKYHIQTSGRSLHAQEIEFNDIRTTLQALWALMDNCNSLHTNAYDEAITTPTEESVRRAMAIQLIINRELGLSKNENPLQGSFIIEELTDLVEEAVLNEFDNLNSRGGVLGAMETGYQRNKIQEESLTYENMKHDGTLPIIGVNTFLGKSESSIHNNAIPVIRATIEEKERQITKLNYFQKSRSQLSSDALKKLKKSSLSGGNIFSELMETTKFCSLGEITHALYEVGGRYRRNM